MPFFKNSQHYDLNNKYKLCQESILAFVPQAIDSFKYASTLKVPNKYKQVKNIVFGGMGGSSLPSRLVSSLFELKVPFTHVEDYKLPAWADNHTLLIISSYSGNTEETISLAQEGFKKGCLIYGITSGGYLFEFFYNHRFPSYTFDTSLNVSLQPRFGLAFMIFGILGFLSNQGLVSGYSTEKVSREIKKIFKELNLSLNEIHKSVKEISSRSNTKYYNFIGASHLVGNARLASSQVSESSKILSFYSEMPEACHNLIEGYSGDNYDINTIILGSDNYHVQINKRLATFKDLVEDMNLAVEVIHFPKPSKFGEGIFYLFFSSLLSLELAKKYREDPISIPHVEKIKRNL